MGRPGILCKLKKGLLLDAQPGFVDTFNWLVDFVGNLQGDADVRPSGGVHLDRSDEAHPVIEGEGGADIHDFELEVITKVEYGEFGDEQGLSKDWRIRMTKRILTWDKQAQKLAWKDELVAEVKPAYEYIDTIAHDYGD